MPGEASMISSTTKVSGTMGVSSQSSWKIFDPSNGPATYTLITEPIPAKKKAAAKLPSLAKLNARLAATEATALARAEASAMKLIGRKQI